MTGIGRDQVAKSLEKAFFSAALYAWISPLTAMISALMDLSVGASLRAEYSVLRELS